MKQMNFEDIEYGPAEDDGEFFGYRLDRMCIRNFGGYHGEPQTLLFGNNGTILTGANGAGKTTAIDAFSLLFNTNPSFNAAANAPSSRSVESYYKGVYEQNQTAGTEKTLRSLGDKNMFMGISATFKKSDGQKYSVVRLTYISDAGNVTNFYVTAKDMIILKDDFPMWLSYGVLRGECEKHGWNLYNTFESYLKEVAETFGFESLGQCKDAFRFLGKSIKQEPITCVTKFARKNILPEKDFSAVMESAATAVAKCQHQLHLIQESQKKIGDLSKVNAKVIKVQELEKEENEGRLIQSRISQFTDRLRAAKSKGFANFHNSKLIPLQNELAAAETDLKSYKEELKKVKAAISDAGIDRVEDMRKEEVDLARKIGHRTQKIQDLLADFNDLGVHLDASSALAWKGSFEKLEAANQKLQDSLAEDRAHREEVNREKIQQESVVRTIAEQLKSLKDSRTSLDPKLVNARNIIAKDLGLGSTSLPFFAELVQIREGEEDWEGVANRVLNSLGQTIMVPDEYYRDAKRIMNKGRWGAFVRLARVDNHASAATIKPGSLADKLMIASDYAYQDALREKLAKSAFHACLDQDEFVKSSEPAVTKEGSIQRGAGQAEKNDRRNVNDSSTYILGWSVEGRIEQLSQKLSIESQKYENLSTHYRQWSETISSKEGKTQKAQYRLLPLHGEYEEYETDGLRRELENLRAELAVMESKQSFDLIRRSEELQESIDTLDKGVGDLRMKVHVHQRDAGTYEEEVEAYHEGIEDKVEEHGPLTDAQEAALNDIAAEVLGVDGEDPVTHVEENFTLDVVPYIFKINKMVADEAKDLSSEIAQNRERAISDAEKFLRSYPDEAQDMDASALLDDTEDGDRCRKEWAARLAQLEEDDLASAEDAQREELRASVRSAPAQLAAAIEDFDLSVRRRIDVINDILKDHVFDPVDHTRARLSLRRSQDRVIANFDQALRDAVSTSMDDSGDDPEVVMQVIDALLGGSHAQDEARKAILSDLRNRWDVSVIEYRIDENGETQTKRDVGSRVGDLSGGQIERMTNLLTGAALSSAFGSHDQFRRDKSLMMVILDEAFSKSSKETSKASSDIYKAMGIQMVVAAPSDKLNFDTDFAQRIIEVITTDGQATSISQPLSNFNFDVEIDI